METSKDDRLARLAKLTDWANSFDCCLTFPFLILFEKLRINGAAAEAAMRGTGERQWMRSARRADGANAVMNGGEWRRQRGASSGGEGAGGWRQCGGEQREGGVVSVKVPCGGGEWATAAHE